MKFDLDSLFPVLLLFIFSLIFFHQLHFLGELLDLHIEYSQKLLDRAGY